MLTDKSSCLQSVKINVDFPYKSKFAKDIYPIIHTKKVEKRIGPPPPILPEYLKEISSIDNPFTEIKEKRIDQLKMLEKERNDYEKTFYQTFPLQENVGRVIRNKFKANYDLKKLIYTEDMSDIFSSMESQSSTKPNKTIVEEKYSPNIDYIVDKRKVCLLDLSVNFKEGQLKNLDDIISQEEKAIKEVNENLQKELDAHDQNLKMICQKTSDAIKLAEKQTMKKNAIIDKVKRSRYNMAHLNAECVKLEEEYIRLKTYKEFLRQCHNQHENRQILERTSFMEELKIDVLMKNVEFDSQSFESQDSNTDEDLNTLNKMQETIVAINSNNNNNNNNNNKGSENFKNDVNPLDKGKLNNFKLMILSGFSNMNNELDLNELVKSARTSKKVNFQSSDTNDKLLDENDLYDTDMYFDSPQNLVDLLSDLEANNLGLIENVQEQEEMCEHLKSKIKRMKAEMENQTTLIGKHVKKEELKIGKLKDAIACIDETNQFLNTFDELEKYKKIFNFGDLQFTKIDEMIDYLHEKISTLYHSVFEKVDSTKSNTVEMLRRIESLIDALYIELQSYDKVLIHKAKKSVDERKREVARLRQKQLTKEAEARKIEKAMLKAQMPPRYRYGRKVVYRSNPPKPISHEMEINWDEIAKQEEFEFFFT